MDLNEMKATWQQAGASAGTTSKLTEIVSTRKHLTVVRKARFKLLVEAVFMVLLLVFFYDIFDGDKKPAYASIALVIGSLLYFLSNLLGYFMLQQVVKEQNIKASLAQLLRLLKRTKLFSLAAMVFFALTLLLFFTSAVELNLKRLLLTAALVAFVLVQAYFAARMWNGWINRIARLLDELAE